MRKSSSRKRALRTVGAAALAAGLCLLLAGCVPGDGVCTAQHPAGFFWGVWHGWVAPVSLVLGLFDPHIRVYETHNLGWLYDFGFYIAIIAGFGSFALFRHHHHD